MKILFAFFLTTTFFVSSLVSHEASTPTHKKLFVLAETRSGNSLSMAILCTMLKRRGLAFEKKGVISFPPRFSDEKKNRIISKAICRSHTPEYLTAAFPEMNSPDNQLYVIVRNPKELLARYFMYVHKMSSSELELLSDRIILSFIRNYFDVLKYYDNWIGDKILIYYEDFIEDYDSTVTKIANFICLSEDDLRNFNLSYGDLRDKVLDRYNRVMQELKSVPSITRGAETLYHSLNFSTYKRISIDRLLTRRYFRLVSKYLQRYMEQ